MEMATLKDVEQGVPEERDSHEPLLGTIYENGQQPKIPHRPVNLPSFDTWNLPRHYPSNLTMFDSTPSSEPSTVNNTPLGEGVDNLPKRWRRSDRRLRRLNTELLEAIETHDVEEVERLLKAGANPNATCRLDLVSACHVAALHVNDTLALLLKFGAEKYRQDSMGRTPLHLAAWAGNAKQMAILLDFPEDMYDRVGDEFSSDVEADVRKLCEKTRTLANVRCDLGEVKPILPSTWKDNIDHNCRDIKCSLPLLQPGWTPLHVATSCARLHCTRLLLAAGADPNICDLTGRTALDVVGSAIYFDQEVDSQNFTEVIRMLLKAGALFNTMKIKGLSNVDSPLHTAVVLDNLEAINELLNAGASNACLNSAGQTPLHVCIEKQFEECLQVLANYGNNDVDPLCASVDVKDREGHTVLQAAVEAAWVPGVCVALEAGADVTLKANDGETPIHSAAALGNLDVLNEILSVAKQKDALDYQNEEGETALFKAVKHGHIGCVEAILNEGASFKITLPGDVNVLHIAAESGHADILKFLIEYDEEKTNEMINALTAGDRRGFGPIHFAVAENNVECVKLLLSKRADVRLRTTCSPHKSSTPLHVAAVKNSVEIAKVILNFDKTTIYEVNSMGWFPIHSASHHGSRDIITLLLREGADLSGYTDGPKKFRRTAMDMIINNLSKPTEFMEDVFDSYIATNNLNLQDPNCEITIDYRILMPSVCEMEQMKVIEALLKTGNRYGQKRLLVHPLVESFLYLKWKALLPFFYTIIAVYAFFLMSLTVFVVSVFFYNDTHEEPPVWLNPQIWGYVMYASICLILIQEMLYMNVKSSRYFLQLETWVKFGSIGLAIILPLAVLIISGWSDSEWPRHVATLALLLSWLEMMFLLSRFPNWGYYVLMFGKVASNVIKILCTFAFLVIGFSLSFMIQFHSQMPFESPWAAMVKTVVMMTSEFDYEALFDEEHSADLATSLVIVRIIFLVFLILAAIVLMNLMVGVAVNDINDLEILGNIRRLAKQVEFLSTLDTLVYNRVFKKLLPKKVNNSIKTKRNVRSVLTLSPGKPKWRHYKIMPSRIRDAIFEKAMRQKKQMDDEMGFQEFKSKIEEIHTAVVKDKEKRLEIEAKNLEGPGRHRARHEEIMKCLNEIDDEMTEMKDQMNTYVEGTKSPIDELNVKMDQMSLEIEAIKHFLTRLESKIGRL
ncbi:transient receptor potential channel pyrexia isoform X2 [Amyelois transitella]|uniref:transient receptor potential channel pyrexia isoform X2 n=1 Tax=Amyelois transitella TaxID=680683 RepID=UPI00299016B6|nr:transient receptor potential channel pyrexia isoform X2 [Amyelois transitella]